MIWTKVTVRVDSRAYSSDNQQRTPGVHISDITIPMSGGEKETAFTESDLEVFRASGYMWEDIRAESLTKEFVELALARRMAYVAWVRGEIMRCGEIATNGVDTFSVEHHDGEIPNGYIILTPDGIDVEYVCPSCGRRGALREFKATWKSLNMNDAVEKPLWHYNVKAYARALGLCTVNMSIWFANGDWRPPRPVMQEWSSGCVSQTELDENWESVMRFGKRQGIIA